MPKKTGYSPTSYAGMKEGQANGRIGRDDKPLSGCDASEEAKRNRRRAYNERVPSRPRGTVEL